MKAHDLTTIFTSLALLCAVACDPTANASDKAQAAKTDKGSAAPDKPAAAKAEPEKPAGEPHHCDLAKAIGHCFQWSLEADAAKAKEEFCTGSKGTFAKGPCPSEGDLGTCTLKGDKDIHYYSTHGHYQASPAKTECTALKRGTWTAS